MKPKLFVASDMITFLLSTVQHALALIPQSFGSLEQYFIAVTIWQQSNGSMGWVRVVQSLPTHFVLKILHKFSMGFILGELPGQSTTLITCSSKIVSLFFCRMTGSQILFKNIPFNYKHSFHFPNHICHTTSHYFSVFIISVIG